ncbi:MAG: purine-nucleoside phosphorylase [Clostridia bacterium]|nr:purine-nucleoside phosphorylase [Clostridia bacterium]
MANYPTPHINAKPGDFGKTVLMPGDPLRSKFIAETFLESPVLVNNVRGVQGYTGTYKGTKVSVMASGMGIPSIGIYSYELYNFFEVDNIIRVGSCGGYADKVNLRDIIIAQGACTDSNFMTQFHLPGVFAPIADYTLLQTAVDAAKELGFTNTHVGNILSSDRFYGDDAELPEEMKAKNLWKKMGVLGVEMESAALYANAARCGKKALGIFTCSDHLFKTEFTTAEERQNSFTDMMKLALEVAVKMEER